MSFWLVTHQEHAERLRSVLCYLTVAKHQGPCAHDQNDRNWSPQTTDHVHALCGDQSEQKFKMGTVNC